MVAFKLKYKKQYFYFICLSYCYSLLYFYYTSSKIFAHVLFCDSPIQIVCVSPRGIRVFTVFNCTRANLNAPDLISSCFCFLVAGKSLVVRFAKHSHALVSSASRISRSRANERAMAIAEKSLTNPRTRVSVC